MMGVGAKRALGLYRSRATRQLIDAVAEGGTGPWYIRVLGPKATMAKWEASVEDFLSSLRLE